ncbi:UNVERIFIED_CONTAM: hypothetical protein K2H54_041088 [Gekko kuhli]
MGSPNTSSKNPHTHSPTHKARVVTQEHDLCALPLAAQGSKRDYNRYFKATLIQMLEVLSLSPLQHKAEKLATSSSSTHGHCFQISGCTVGGGTAIMDLLMKQTVQEFQVDCTSQTASANTQHKNRTGESKTRGGSTHEPMLL